MDGHGTEFSLYVYSPPHLGIIGGHAGVQQPLQFTHATLRRGSLETRGFSREGGAVRYQLGGDGELPRRDGGGEHRPDAAHRTVLTAAPDATASINGVDPSRVSTASMSAPPRRSARTVCV